MRMLHLSPRYLVVVLALVTACSEPGQPIKLGPAPDAAPPIGDAIIELDVQAIDAEPDMQPDAKVLDMGEADAALPDYVTEIPNDVLPEAHEYVVIGGGDETTVVWWRGGRLFKRQFRVEIAPGDDERPQPIGPIDPDRVTVAGTTPEFLTYLPPFERPLSGIRAPNQQDGHPGWVFLPSSDGTTWLSLGLSNGDSDATPLGLHGPLRLGSRSAGAADPDQLVVVGAMGPESDAAIGSVVFNDTMSSEPATIGRNRPLPVDITTTGSHWVFAYQDGICALLEGAPSGPANELGTWRCGSSLNTRLVGRGSMNLDSTGFYAVGQTTNEVVAWDPRPGVATYPNELVWAEQMLEDNPSADAGTEATDVGMAQPLDLGAADSGLDDARLPDAGIPLTEALISVSPTTDLLTWSNPVSYGRTARLSSGAHLVLEQGRIRQVDAMNEAVLGLMSTTGDRVFAIVWDSQTGQPEVRPVEAAELVVPPNAPESACPSRAPETCDHTDNDCDGYAYGSICCHYTFAFDDVSLPSTEPLNGPWFVKNGDEGPLTGVAYAERVEMHTLGQGRNACLGCWPQATELKHMSGFGAVYVLNATTVETADSELCSADCPLGPIVETPVEESVDLGVGSDGGAIDGGALDGGIGDAGDASDASVEDAGDAQPPQEDIRNELLWHLAPRVLARTEAPCRTVRHIETYGESDGTSVWVFCDERRYDYRIVNGSFVHTAEPVDYPFGPAHWLSPPVKRREGGSDVTYLMAASGNDYALHLLRVSQAGWMVVPTPERNMSITVADRDIPFRPAITEFMRPARIQGAAQLELHFGAQGWLPAVSGQWVRRVHFSAHDNYALSVVETLDPTAPGFDDIQQTLEIQVHDLNTNGNHWGRNVRVRSSAILSHSFHGISVADFSERENERSVWMGLGRNRSPVVLSGFGLRCRGESDF